MAIDGQVIAVVNQYAEGRDMLFDWSHRGLQPGKHTFRIRVLGQKRPQAKDCLVCIVGLEPIEEGR